MRFPLAVVLLLGATGCNISLGSCLPLTSTQAADPKKLGVGLQFTAGEEIDEAGLAMTFLGSTGVTVARVPLSWARIQPERSTLNWSVPDAVVAAARKAGVRLHLVLKDTPAWASSAPAVSTSRGTYPPAVMEDWNRFVQQAATRYGKDVSEWEIWDGIDTRFGWTGRPDEYARLTVTAGKAIRSANPQARLVLGSVGFGPGRESLFLDNVLQDRSYPVLKTVDAFSLRPGAVMPSEVRERYFALKRTLGRQDATAKPILITGVAWSSDSARQGFCASYQGGDTGQARYLTEIMPWLLQLGAERVYWDQLWDGPVDQAEGALGLLDRKTQPKPALAALASLIDPNRVVTPSASDIKASPSPLPSATAR